MRNLQKNTDEWVKSNPVNIINTGVRQPKHRTNKCTNEIVTKHCFSMYFYKR
jgi:hypothetical protein